ncbi:MAG: hypothetical protein ABEN55_06065, partial [Bradymonadaceae bacterium]
MLDRGDARRLEPRVGLHPGPRRTGDRQRLPERQQLQEPGLPGRQLRASPCTQRSQCAGDQACQTASISKDGNSGEFVVCDTLPEEKCTSSGSCSDGIRRCNDVRQSANNQIDAYCKFPNSGASGSLGNSCSQNADCKSGLCAGQLGTPIRDVCSVACVSDSQCASGQTCASLPFSNTDVATCTKPCSYNGDCASGNVCMI